MHSAGLLGQRRLLAVPDFSENLVVLIPGNSGTENDRVSRAPGKREPGNPHPIAEVFVLLSHCFTLI